MRYIWLVLTCAALAAAQTVQIEPTVETPAVTESCWVMIQSYGTVPADWINPTVPHNGANLSEMISHNPPCAISFAERKGTEGMIILASAPTWGTMFFRHRNGYVSGFTVVDEPLVVQKSELRMELWRKGDQVHMRKWYRVLRGLRCGNEFRAIALREISLTIPPPCPVKEIRDKFTERTEYVDRLVYKQVEAPGVTINITRPPELVVVVQNPVVEMRVEFMLPAPSAPIGFVPVQSCGQINAMPRQPSIERTLVSVSVAFVPVPRVNVSQTQSQGQSQSQTGGTVNNTNINVNNVNPTCPPLPVHPPQPPPLPPGAHGPLTPGSGIVVHPNPDPSHGQNHGDWVPPQPPPSAAGGP